MRTIVAAGALLLAFGLAGCNGGPGASAASPTPAGPAAINITLKAGAGENSGPGSSCGAANFGTAFFDLPGTQVTVTNEAGVTVGIGSVPQTGKIATLNPPEGPYGIFTEACVFTFSIPLDGDAKFYKVDFGSSSDPTRSAARTSRHRPGTWPSTSQSSRRKRPCLRTSWLLTIEAADEAVPEGTFFASTGFGGSTKISHPGFPGRHEIEIEGAGLIDRLALDALIAVTSRSDGVLKFAMTRAGRTEAERLRLGGRSALESARERADRAETALAGSRAAGAARRDRLADRLAWFVGLLVGLVFAAILYAAVQSPVKEVAAVAAFVLILGVTGLTPARWLRRPLARQIDRLLLLFEERL